MFECYDLQGNLLSDEDGQKLISSPARIIKQETVNNKFISTVHIVFNHNSDPDGLPLIFETMVFPNSEDFEDEYCERYSSLEDALAGHQRAVTYVQGVTND